MTLYIVSSGFTDQLFDLHSGDVMSVLSSGTSEQNLVSGGGQLLVAAGGESLSDTVFSGGLEVLASGAVASNLTVSSGGVVSAAGMLAGTTVDLGLISGGAVVSQMAAGFGSMTVASHGVASGVTVSDSFVFVQSGGTTRNLLAMSGAAVTVSEGGTTTGTTLRIGGATEYLHGSAQGTIISATTTEQISAGGLATGAVISSGGKQLVSSGGVASGTIISYGGSETVYGSGVAQGSLIANGGQEDVQSGGLASAFAISSGGALTVSSGGVLGVGSTGTSTNFGYVDVQSTSEMDLAGTLDNGGIVSLDDDNTVNVTAAKATLTGSGVIDLADDVLITGLAPSDTLDNESNIIEGTGLIGGDSLTVINRGTIDANAADNLTLDATLFTNTGLIEVTDGGGALLIYGAINNSGGVIDAKNAPIYFEGGTALSGGVLSASGEGLFTAVGSVGLSGVGQALTNKAEVNITDGSALTLDGAIDNVGEISVGGGADDTDLVIDGPTVTLTGSGTVLMSDAPNNQIYGDATTFTNVLDNVNNTIEGAGEIGDDKLSLVNSGTIDATGTANSLVIDTTSATNTGLIESTGAAGLLIVASINNSGGVIAANQGDVYLEGGAAIVGGTVASSPHSQIDVSNTTTSAVTLNGAASALTNNGDIYVEDASQLDLVGAIVNNGEISISGSTGFTDLVVSGPSATLTGGGTLELSDGLYNQIYGASAADKLTNVDNTIEGAGTIGVGELTLVNQGTVDASGTNALFLNTTSTVNTGLIESTNVGGLLIETAVGNAGGVIAANGGSVFIEDGAVVSGGLLSATSEADIYVVGSATLNGVASPLSNTATVVVDDNAQLSLAGAIVNDGVISQDSSGDTTTVLISAANVTLTGSGTLELSDQGGNRIIGAASSDVLDNETDTIEGAGDIGLGQLTLINRGTIDATGSVNALLIQTTSATNSGLMEATTAPGLILNSIISNAGGVIGAFGGDVYVDQDAAISGGTLSGENGVANDILVSSGGAVLGASIASGAVEIVFSGASQSGVAVLSGGMEQVLSAATVSASLVMSGGVEMMSADAATSAATVFAGGVLEGAAYLRGAVIDDGLVSGAAVASGGLLSVSSGGVDSATAVKSGGRTTVFANGLASGDVVSSGAKELISSGGVASGTKLLSGGAEYVYSGGVASGTKLSGGDAAISAGGSAVRAAGPSMCSPRRRSRTQW